MRKLFLIGAVALGLGFAACNNTENVPEPQGKGGHYLSVSLSIAPSSTARATIAPDSKPGLGVESSLEEASAVLVAFPTSTAGTPVVSPVLALASTYNATGAPTYAPLETAAVEVPAGTYDVYVVVGPAEFASKFATNVAATQGIMYQKDLFESLNNLLDINGLTTANSFVMSSRAKAPVTAQTTKVLAIDAVNRAKVQLDRVVAKVTVVTPAATVPVQTPNPFTAALAGFTLEQGKMAEYTMMQDKVVPTAADFADANDFNPSSPVLAAGRPNYISFPVWGDVSNAFGACPGRASDNGLYTTENTSEYTGEAAPLKFYQVGMTTYALIRIKITPTTLVNNGGTAETDGTFYFGLSDKKFYDNSADAGAANGDNNPATDNAGSAGDNGYLKYKQGYAYYTVWVGQNYITKNYSPVVRNRWYNLNVTNILQLGTPYDPINPTNPKVPYIPGTDGPTTPPTPPSPEDPIVPVMKYIAAQLEVMNWTAVDRDVELK